MRLYHGTNIMFDEIDLPTLVCKLKYMKGLTIQYFFGTEKALSILKRIK